MSGSLRQISSFKSTWNSNFRLVETATIDKFLQYSSILIQRLNDSSPPRCWVSLYLSATVCRAAPQLFLVLVYKMVIVFEGGGAGRRSRSLESERCAIKHFWYSGHFRNSGFSPVGWFRGYEYWHFYLCEWWWALTSEVSSNLLKPLNWALFLRYHDFGCLFSGIRQNQNSYGVAQHTVAKM